MKKKTTLLIVLLFMSLFSYAQFQEGKAYVGTSLTGVDFHYNGKYGLNIGIEAKGGYFFFDNLMLLGSVSAVHNGSKAVADHFSIGAGGRYYITQNGIYLGAGCKFVHANHNYNDLMPNAEVGYAFYVNRSVTVEPAIYYDHSFKGSKYSTIGFKIGVGVYLFDD